MLVHEADTSLTHKRLLRGELWKSLRCLHLPVGSLIHYEAFSLSTNSYVDSDTIRILVATDSHVGYEERDAIRKDDSWRSFDEVMQLAKAEDVCICASKDRIFSDIC